FWPKLFFFSSRRRHTRLQGDWSSDVCSSDLADLLRPHRGLHQRRAPRLARPVGEAGVGRLCRGGPSLPPPALRTAHRGPERARRSEARRAGGALTTSTCSSACPKRTRKLLEI